MSSVSKKRMGLVRSHSSDWAKLSAKAWAFFTGCSSPRPGPTNKVEDVLGRDEDTQGLRQYFLELRQQQGPGLLKPHNNIKKQALGSTGLHSQSGHRKAISSHHQNGEMAKSMGIFPLIHCFPCVWNFGTTGIPPNLDEFSYESEKLECLPEMKFLPKLLHNHALSAAQAGRFLTSSRKLVPFSQTEQPPPCKSISVLGPAKSF